MNHTEYLIGKWLWQITTVEDEFELLHEQYKSSTEFFSKQTTEVERNIKDLKTCYNAMTKVLSEMRNDRYRDLLETSLEESVDQMIVEVLDKLKSCRL